MATHCSILAWKTHGLRAWLGYSLWGHIELSTIEHVHMLICISSCMYYVPECLCVYEREGGNESNRINKMFVISLNQQDLFVRITKVSVLNKLAKGKEGNIYFFLGKT